MFFRYFLKDNNIYESIIIKELCINILPPPHAREIYYSKGMHRSWAKLISNPSMGGIWRTSQWMNTTNQRQPTVRTRQLTAPISSFNSQVIYAPLKSPSNPHRRGIDIDCIKPLAIRQNAFLPVLTN